MKRVAGQRGCPGGRCVLLSSAALYLVLAAKAGIALGQDLPTLKDVEDRVGKLERALSEQSQIIALQTQALQRQQVEINTLRTLLSRSRASDEPRGVSSGAPQAETAQPVRATSRAQAQAQPTTQTSAQGAPATSAPTTAPETEERGRPNIDVEPLVERGGVLTPPGTLILEGQVEYITDTSDRVLIEGLSVLPAILVGNIDVRRSERDTFFFSAVARYGVTSRFDVDVKVPFTYRREQTTARDLAVESSAATVSSLEGGGLGDIEFAGHYQMTDGEGGWPFFIANLRVKPPTGKDPFELDTDAQGIATELPTGSGFWAVEPSVSFLLPSAPAVWFGNVKYLANIERDVGDGFGTIDPGDAIGATLGLAFALNPKTSFSLGWEYQYVMETRQNGEAIDGTALRIASGLLGMSYRVNDDVVLNLSAQAGVTDDAPDFRLLLRVPIAFSL